TPLQSILFPYTTLFRSSISELPVDSPRDPRKRKELPQVRVPGKLQSDSGFFRDRRLVRCMRQQNTRARRINCSFRQHRSEMLGRSEEHTSELQSRVDLV